MSEKFKKLLLNRSLWIGTGSSGLFVILIMSATLGFNVLDYFEPNNPQEIVQGDKVETHGQTGGLAANEVTADEITFGDKNEIYIGELEIQKASPPKVDKTSMSKLYELLPDKSVPIFIEYPAMNQFSAEAANVIKQDLLLNGWTVEKLTANIGKFDVPVNTVNAKFNQDSGNFEIKVGYIY